MNEPHLSTIVKTIKKLEQNPPEGDIKKLQGYADVYRVRAGGYRILYIEENDVRVIFKIAPRGGAYKEKK